MRTFSSLGFTVALVATSGLMSIAAGLPDIASGPAPAQMQAGRPAPCVPGIAHELPEVTIERFDQGYWGVPCVFMARNPAEWDLIMSDMEARGELILLPAPPAPAVNWKKQNVIVASLGQLNTNGYSIDVQSVKRVQATAVVALEIHLPPGDAASPTITSPYHMVAVDKAGMKSVQVCTRTYVYGSGAAATPARVHANLDFESIQPPLDDPPVVGETWGSLKARH